MEAQHTGGFVFSKMNLEEVMERCWHQERSCLSHGNPSLGMNMILAPRGSLLNIYPFPTRTPSDQLFPTTLVSAKPHVLGVCLITLCEGPLLLRPVPGSLRVCFCSNSVLSHLL